MSATTGNPGSTKSSASSASSSAFGSAFEQYADVRDELFATARKTGNLYLDAYEQAVGQALELETEFARNTQQEWLQRLIEAHVNASRRLTESYTTVARKALS